VAKRKDDHSLLESLAVLGAHLRLEQLEKERRQIEAFLHARQRPNRARFPDTSSTIASGPRRQQHRSMSAAQRRAVSERMKKYWAARRKTSGVKTRKQKIAS
jgi:hypothetical protein